MYIRTKTVRKSYLEKEKEKELELDTDLKLELKLKDNVPLMSHLCPKSVHQRKS